MRLLTFTECARRLDPDGGNIVTESWLRGQLRAVKVGKRHLVPEPVFIEFCEELLRQCQEAPSRQGSNASRAPAVPSPVRTKAEESASVQRALTTINALLKPSG
jgi:hypothetical protein